ncbi:MAG: hypothetical protein M1426_02610, partial [Patescibacteria group bacterium]|nr:hypothetical protein [Patescibacteria group bacterium]
MNTTLKKQSSWNLKPLFESDDDPAMLTQREQVATVHSQFVQKWKEKDFLQNPWVLKEALDEYENLHRFYSGGGKESYYFQLRTSQDENDPKLKAKFNQVQEFSKKLENDLQFFE